MANMKPLFWSHLYDYENCPQKFLWTYGWVTIDLGNGLGKGKTKPESSRHHAVMGIVIQGVLEDLYNKELWKDTSAPLETTLRKLTAEKLSKELQRNYVDWGKISFEEIHDTCENGVLGYLKTMKGQKLLGPYAKSEVELKAQLTDDLVISGRADFIIQREDSGVMILDGKNSKTKMKNVNPDQLRYYALCFSLIHQALPDRLAFVWFRYPYDESIGESGVDWIEYTSRDLKSLSDRAVVARQGMIKEDFPANPQPSYCKNCDFEDMCPERQAQKENNRRKRGKKGSSLPIVTDNNYLKNGPVEIGFSIDDLLE
jgi:CRISPR/Cas system-associated exonuclease Cas4 (RecB family)